MLRALFCLVMMAGWWQQQAPSAPVVTAAPVAEQSSFRISGTVVDAMSGQALAHARVTISAQGIRDSARATVTGEDGRFVFENLAAGHYALFARRTGYLQQLYKQHEQFSTAIIVGPGLNSENLRFELRPQGSISGQVLDEMNEGMRNAQVTLFRGASAQGRHTNWRQQTVQTNDLGRFHFGHLSPGTYYVAVSAQAWYAQRVTHQRMQQTDSSGQTTFQEVTNGEPELDVVYPLTFFPNAPDIAGAAPITVRAGDAETADLRMQPLPALHMTVHVPSAAAAGDGAEGENVYAQVIQTVGDGAQMGTSAISQQIAPGIVEITGLAPGRFNLRLVSNKGGESTSHSQTVQIASDSELTLNEGSNGATVSGIAQLENGGAPPPAATILLRARSNGENFAMQVEQNGEFHLKSQTVPPGTYDVLVGPPPATAVKSMSGTGAKVSGRSVEIVGGQDVRLNVVLSQGTGRITGYALKDGKPVDGVMIVLVPEVPDHNLVLFRRDQSDSDGTFTLPGVHPGKYAVVAIEDGWELEWLTPAVIQKYLAGGEAVQVTADAKIEVKVKVQASQ